jgi:uncharacterized protein (TIGR00255 family)
MSTPASASAPVYSMTGFARISRRVSESLGFTLSLKSVNHRFLDLHMRMPGGTESLEMQLRRELKQRLVRGHIEVTLNLDRGQRAEASYDAGLVDAYLSAFHAASAQHGLTGVPDLNSILRLPGIFNADTRGSDRGSEEETRALEAAVLSELPALIEALNTMRAQEGSALAAELAAGLDRLQYLVDQAATLREDVRQAYFERISQRISEMLNGPIDRITNTPAVGALKWDRDRVLQEAALLAERSDVDEEITRLRTHIEHFRCLIQAGGEIGKKLDFLLQEMNREANTLLSKTGGIAGNGPRITELGLGMKSEIEKAREQVQNLE